MDFQLNDLPQDVMDEVASQLKYFFVPIFALSSNLPDPGFRLVGSGTLVEMEGKHFILTAAHVWHETTGAKEIGLILTEAPFHAFVKIERQTICDVCLWNGNISEWGPDLAFLELPVPVVQTISAHKSFLNFHQKREKFTSRAPNTEKGLWAVTGMVGELSKISQSADERIVRGTVHGNAFFSVAHESHLKGDYDFIDIPAKMALPFVPSSFKGVSGGGLWEVGISIDDSSGKIFWDGKRNFRGVAFWQTEISDGRRLIRCHGPRSIFEKGWGVWPSPQIN